MHSCFLIEPYDAIIASFNQILARLFDLQAIRLYIKKIQKNQSSFDTFVTNLMFENSVLSIKLDYQKIVQLTWDFRGTLKNDVYFRHVLISQTSQSQFFHVFCQQYYSRIKNGDLICSVTPYDKHSKLKWSQKMPHSTCYDLRRKYEPSKNQTLAQLFDRVADHSAQFSEPIFLNIVYDYKPNLQKIRLLIDQYRSKSIFKFVINIFGSIQNEVNFGNGINFLSSEEQNIKASLNFIKWYCNNISALNVQLELQCLDGSFNVQSVANWKNVDFNRIKKSYVGLTSHQYTEDLFFLEHGKIMNSKNPLNIKIKYTLLNGQKYESQRKFWINSQKYKLNTRTCNQRLQVHFQISPGFMINGNPYVNQAYIRMEKQNK